MSKKIYKQLKEMAELRDKQYEQGPRNKNYASQQLEQLVVDLLDPRFADNFETKINALNELEINLDNKTYNVTQILMHKPDFEHLSFSKKNLDQYTQFVSSKAILTPEINSQMATEEVYAKRDPKGQHANLHLAEKQAITIYTGNGYPYLQSFLRNNAQNLKMLGSNVEINANNVNDDLAKKSIKEYILGICVAGHGLAKPSLNQAQAVNEDNAALLRVEDAYKSVLEERDAGIANSTVVTAAAFTSTSNPDVEYKGVSNSEKVKLLYSDNALGKEISKLSKYMREAETLLMPGTQFDYSASVVENNERYYLVTPVRSIEGLDNIRFNKTYMEIHNLQVMSKVIQNSLDNSIYKKITDLLPHSKSNDLIAKINKMLESAHKNEELSTKNLEEIKTNLLLLARELTASPASKEINQFLAHLNQKIAANAIKEPEINKPKSEVNRPVINKPQDDKKVKNDNSGYSLQGKLLAKAYKQKNNLMSDLNRIESKLKNYAEISIEKSQDLSVALVNKYIKEIYHFKRSLNEKYANRSLSVSEKLKSFGRFDKLKSKNMRPLREEIKAEISKKIKEIKSGLDKIAIDLFLKIMKTPDSKPDAKFNTENNRSKRI